MYSINIFILIIAGILMHTNSAVIDTTAGIEVTPASTLIESNVDAGDDSSSSSASSDSSEENYENFSACKEINEIKTYLSKECTLTCNPSDAIDEGGFEIHYICSEALVNEIMAKKHNHEKKNKKSETEVD